MRAKEASAQCDFVLRSGRAGERAGLAALARRSSKALGRLGGGGGVCRVRSRR